MQLSQRPGPNLTLSSSKHVLMSTDELCIEMKKLNLLDPVNAKQGRPRKPGFRKHMLTFR